MLYCSTITRYFGAVPLSAGRHKRLLGNLIRYNRMIVGCGSGTWCAWVR